MNVKEKILKKIIRVDQAGELGAQQIYQGQKMIFKLQKNKKDFDQISKMAADEKAVSYTHLTLPTTLVV